MLLIQSALASSSKYDSFTFASAETAGRFQTTCPFKMHVQLEEGGTAGPSRESKIIKSRDVELDLQESPEEIKSREVELDPQVSPEEIKSREVALDLQESPEEIKNLEVELDLQESPEEIKNLDVELDLQQSPEEVKSREVELGSHRELDNPLLQLFLSSCFADIVFVTLFRRAVQTAVTEVRKLFWRWLTVSSVFAGRSVRTSYSRLPLPPASLLPVPNNPYGFCGR